MSVTQGGSFFLPFITFVMDTDRRDKLVGRASLAEVGKRFNDMIHFMEEILLLEGGNVLSVQERNLLSVAFKGAVDERRQAVS